MTMSFWHQIPGRFNNMPFHLLQPVVNETLNNTQAPLELVLFSALSAAGMVIQGLADVEQPTGKVTPVSLMTMVIAASGERKSTVEGIHTRAIRVFEEKRQRKHKKHLAEWEEWLQVWELKRRVLEKAVQKRIAKDQPAYAEEEALKEHLRAKPPRPPQFKMLYEDTTAAALFLGMHRDFPYAGLVSSEGGAILNSPAFHDLPKQNALWSGDPVSIDRVSAPSFRLDDARLTVSIMAQPSAMKTYIDQRGEEARGSGLWARFLMCTPATTQGTRFVSNGTMSWEYCDRFGKRLTELLQKVVDGWEWGKEDRDMIRFSPEASATWFQYYNYVEGQICPGGRYADAGDHASKLAENAGRVAAIIHVLEGYEGAISKETLDWAIAICDCASQDFLSVFVPPPLEMRDAQLLDEYLNRLRMNGYTQVAKNQVRRYGPNALRNVARLDCAIGILSHHRRVSMTRVNKTYVLNLYP